MIDPVSMTLGWLTGKRIASQRRKKEPIAPYLTFASAEPFTIGVNNATKNWDGTLYYSTDTVAWNEWDGATAIASAEHGGEQRLYMRGKGNSKITGMYDDINEVRCHWTITGLNVACSGNIENLLDYEEVQRGQHPEMAKYCYQYMFYRCTSLITAPELPAETLTYWCYKGMFNGCTSLTTAPKLPATTMAGNCYGHMFDDCTSLTTVPELPAIALAEYCYASIFKGCTSIKLSAIQDGEYQTAYRIPIAGTGVTAPNALINMFRNTGGTFTGTPEINTTYYLHTSNSVVPASYPIPVYE